MKTSSSVESQLSNDSSVSGGLEILATIVGGSVLGVVLLGFTSLLFLIIGADNSLILSFLIPTVICAGVALTTGAYICSAKKAQSNTNSNAISEVSSTTHINHSIQASPAMTIEDRNKIELVPLLAQQPAVSSAPSYGVDLSSVTRPLSRRG